MSGEIWEAHDKYVFRGKECIGIFDTDNATDAFMVERARVAAAAPDLLRALGDLMEQIECLGGIEYSRDVEPYKAEACWDDAIRRAQSAIAKATSAKIIEFPATAEDQQIGDGSNRP